jgi:hypothetical protein
MAGQGWGTTFGERDAVNLTRMGRLGVAVAASLATIATGLAPSVAQASAQGASPAPTVTHYTGTPGFARLVPRHKPAAGRAAAAQQIPRGARRLPSGHYSATETVPSAPAAAAAAAAATATPSPLVNFNGVSSLDSQVTNFEQKFEPPDQGLCKGHGFVLEPVNSAYRIYRTSGTSLRGPFNINDLFNVGAKEFTSDPRCWFDTATQTWFATILFLNDTFTAGSLLIAVRHNADPRGLWNEYSIDATDLGGNGCPCFGDQTRLGIDQTNLYVTADEFSILGPQFNGAEMWVIDKSDLVAGVASPHVAHFAGLTLDGQLTLAPQPALAKGSPNAEYLLSSLDFTGNGDNRIGVWAVTNRGAVGAGGTPTLSSIIINSEAYAIPPPAPQKGASSTLDSGDDRMQQTEFTGGTIWGEMTTAVQPAGDSSVRAGGAWFQVKPVLGSSGISGASIVRQGYIDSPGRYEIYPSVQPDAAGNAAVVFTLTSPTRFPSAAYATLKAGGSNFGPAVVAASGSGPYDPKATRWGDYSFAVPNDTSDAAWLAIEYMPPKSSQTTTGERNWGTRVIEVPLG